MSEYGMIRDGKVSYHRLDRILTKGEPWGKTSERTMKVYSLSKSRLILRSACKLLKRIKNQSLYQKLHTLLATLEEAIFEKDRKRATELAIEVQALSRQLPYSLVRRTYDFLKAVLFAGIVAFLIRQFWFELYEVPTGSMRPTILEKDRMLVSKTTFGLHNPFSSEPWLFYPKSLTRGGLVVFTVKDLPIANQDTYYFGCIPGKKRYIKRCMGKPGDILYFYGGNLYGIDCNGDPIDFPQLNSLHYVPYISFEGNAIVKGPSVYCRQYYQECGKFSPAEITGNFFLNGSWLPDIPSLLKESRHQPVSYTDLFGMGNYAMVRVLTRQQASLIYSAPQTNSPAYLEISHTANMTYPTPTLSHYGGRAVPLVQPMKTLLPLEQDHLDLLRRNLTTSRFVVTKGLAYKYHPESPLSSSKVLAIPLNVPDGCYEYLSGTAYRVYASGIRNKLGPSHPLMQLTNAQVIDLFNAGIHFSSVYLPQIPQYSPFPYRYAFYNQGDLYVMDVPIFAKDDPTLQHFIQVEKEKEIASSNQAPYIAFIDRGAPPKALQAFKSFITQFGLKVPEGHVLVLGDNYPMSADSREFGFVPVKNLIGSPVCIFWPLGHFGPLTGCSAPTTLPGYLVNSCVIFLILAYLVRWYIQRHQRLFPK